MRSFTNTFFISLLCAGFVFFPPVSALAQDCDGDTIPDVCELSCDPHGVRHRRLDVLLALGAIVALNRVFGDQRLNLMWDVFDDPRPRTAAALQLPFAMRAAFQAVRLVLVDPGRRGAPSARMALASAGLLTSFACVGFLIDRQHARRRGRRRFVFVGGALQFRDARPLLTDSLARGQESQDDRFGAQPVQAAGLRLAEFAAQRGLDQRRCLTRLRRPWLHARLHNSAQANRANYLS